MKRPASLRVTIVTICVLFSLTGMLLASYQQSDRSMVKETRSRGMDDARPQEPPPSGGASAPPPGGPPRLEISEQKTDELVDLMRTLQSNPNDADALRGIGEFFLSTRELGRAVFFLNRAVLSRPNDTRSLRLLGIAQYHQNKIEEAAKSFEDALRIKEDLEAMYFLAIIYKYHSGKKAEGEALLRKIIASPESGPDILAKAKAEL